jgi:hypothetical protein
MIKGRHGRWGVLGFEMVCVECLIKYRRCSLFSFVLFPAQKQVFFRDDCSDANHVFSHVYTHFFSLRGNAL